MRIMAGTAVRFRHRIIHMLFHEVGLVCFMAAHTEGRQIIFQKIISFRRSMWVVATDTSFLHRTVLESRFGNSISNILVAIKTEFVPCFQKDKFVSGGVGIVAFYTIAFHHNFMTAFGIFRHDPFMTLIADLVWILAQQLSMGRGMRVMAFGAFSGFHRSMDKWIFKFFLEGIMAFETEFPLGARFQLEFILPISHSKKQKNYQHAG